MFLKPSARKGIPPFCADASSAVIFTWRTFPLCFWGFLPWGFEFCPQGTCDRHIALDRPCPRNSLPVRCCSLLHFTSRGLPHGSTKMYSLFWDYTSAKSLWLFKHDMLLAPNLLCVTPGGSSSNPPIAAYTYWIFLEFWRDVWCFLFFPILDIYSLQEMTLLCHHQAEIYQFCRVWSSPCPPSPCRDYLYDSPSRLDFPIFLFVKFLRLLG